MLLIDKTGNGAVAFVDIVLFAILALFSEPRVVIVINDKATAAGIQGAIAHEGGPNWPSTHGSKLVRKL